MAAAFAVEERPSNAARCGHLLSDRGTPTLLDSYQALKMVTEASTVHDLSLIQSWEARNKLPQAIEVTSRYSPYWALIGYYPWNFGNGDHKPSHLSTARSLVSDPACLSFLCLL
jgi:hypothetical protein